MGAMNSKLSTARLVASAAAFLTLAGIGVHDFDRPADPGVALTGSGHEATPAPWTQPQTKAMEMGDTEVTTTPPAVPAIARAVPPLGAGK
jgi:hypothetical protein